MRAVLVSEFGGPDQLRLSRAADPVAGPGQARIVVHAAGVNPVDAGPVDAIADLAGGTLAAAPLPALRPGGQIAAISTPELDPGPLLVANITFHGVLIADDGDRTRALAALLDQQALRPVVSHVLPLAAAAEAHRILERRHASGKIILDVTG